MQVSKSFLSNIFSGYNQYSIPVFQRHYAWKKNNWNQLWKSIVDLYNHRDIMTYFMGTMVFSQTSNNPSQFYIFNVIDGQQRLITLSALLIAIRNMASKNGHEKLADKINDMLIFSPDFNKNYYRIQPRYFEKNNYELLILNETSKKENIINEMVNFFSKKIEPYAYEYSNLDILYTIIITRLEFVNIVLDNKENVYRIFKNLNSMGVDLTEADLIRGFVFENIDKENQESFDKYHWKKLEDGFLKERQIDDITLVQFFQHFLTVKKQVRIGEDQIFINFQSEFDNYKNITEYTNDLIYFSELYSYILGNREYHNVSINNCLNQFRKLKDISAYPMILKMLYLFESKQIEEDEFEKIINIVMSFIIRMVTCGAGTRNYNSLFMSLMNLVGDNSVDRITQFLLNRGFPTDKELKYNLIHSSYHTKYYRLILENIESRKNHNELVDFSNLQVEHIMPRTLNNEWINNLGEKYQEIHKLYLNTIGNLTLTGYNRKLYNYDFEVKRKLYHDSNITITRELCSYNQWTDQEIINRSGSIADSIIEIYPIPQGNNGDYLSKRNSKYIGVDLNKGMWRARINKNGKQFVIGYYNDEIDAAIAYNETAKELGKSKFNIIQ